MLISAVEIFLWPRRERRAAIFLLRLFLWLAVLAFDVLTTVRGLLPVLASMGLAVVNEAGQRQWLAYGISGTLGIAFAYLAATVRLAELLLNIGLPDNPVMEYVLAGAGGHRGVGDRSAEVRFLLPGSRAWENVL